MHFMKTSAKFGQWSDPRANTVYGLGFSSENDLNKVSFIILLFIYPQSILHLLPMQSRLFQIITIY